MIYDLCASTQLTSYIPVLTNLGHPNHPNPTLPRVLSATKSPCSSLEVHQVHQVHRLRVFRPRLSQTKYCQPAMCPGAPGARSTPRKVPLFVAVVTISNPICWVPLGSTIRFPKLVFTLNPHTGTDHTCIKYTL